MPSPFLRTQLNIGKKPVRPEPLTPTPENYAGENQTWRGIQDHGVTPQYDPSDPETYTVDVNGRKVPIKYEPPESEPDPIPVRIVQSTAREYRRFQTDRLSVRANTGLPTQLVGKDDNRVNIKVVNPSADKTVYIANEATDLLLRGYPLGPGKEWSSITEEDVWAISADTTDVVVGITVDKVVPERVKHAG